MTRVLPALRHRRFRRRRREGLVVIPVEAPEEVGDILAAAGFIEPTRADDREALAEGLSAVVKVWCKEFATRRARNGRYHGTLPE